MDIQKLTTGDGNLKKTGVWKTFQDAKFLIASSDTPAYRRALHKATKKRGAKVRKDAQAIHEVAIEAMGEACLLDWQGVTSGGEPHPATVENRIALLTASEELRSFVAEEAQDLANFEREGQRDDADEIKSGD